MPTHSGRERLKPQDIHDIVAAATFPHRGPEHGDGVGLEAEALAIQTLPSGATRRLPLADTARIARRWARIEAAVTPTGDHPALPGFGLPDGSRITFEPGGQLEVSGTRMASVSAAASGMTKVLSALARAFSEHHTALVSAGIDLWHDVADVPQQLRAPRYPAMAAYLASRSDAGARMMRHTCSIQVNLDLGPGATRDERWLVANLVAPLATASFATSPDVGGGAVSTRARSWHELDPTRTGFPAALVEGEPDPVTQLTHAALDADVLLVQSDDDATPGTPGWTFRDWVTDGHPTHGFPTPDDLRYHLTTLFHEVRPRGALEIRSIDALPARWRAVPAVLYVGLLYDDRARQQVLEVLRPWRARLPGLLERAPRTGVADASLCAAAVETWSFAIEGARRLPPGTVDDADVRRAEAFVERFTMRGRCPGDELRERFADDPEAALSWASEPVPTVTLC